MLYQIKRIIQSHSQKVGHIIRRGRLYRASQPSIPYSPKRAHKVWTQSAIYNLASSPHNSARAFTMASPCEPRVRLARWLAGLWTYISDFPLNRLRFLARWDYQLAKNLETKKRKLLTRPSFANSWTQTPSSIDYGTLFATLTSSLSTQSPKKTDITLRP